MNFALDASGDRNQSRAIGFAVVVVFHILLIWGLMNGLGRKAIELLPAPIETKILEEIKPPVEAPPPPKPEFEPPPPPYIPPPDIIIQQPVQATTAITQTTTVKPVAPAPPVTPKKVVNVAPKIDINGSPRACREPEYPSASERLGESGISGISLLVGADGKVSQSRVDASSGFKRLDDAAIKAFSRCKFTVGTTNGVPSASWFSIRYKWVVPK